MGVLAGCGAQFHYKTWQVVDQEFSEYLEVMLSIFNNLVPHVHDQEVIVVVDKFFAYFIQFWQELKAFVVDQVGKDKATFLRLLR